MTPDRCGTWPFLGYTSHQRRSQECAPTPNPQIPLSDLPAEGVDGHKASRLPLSADSSSSPRTGITRAARTSSRPACHLLDTGDSPVLVSPLSPSPSAGTGGSGGRRGAPAHCREHPCPVPGLWLNTGVVLPVTAVSSAVYWPRCGRSSFYKRTSLSVQLVGVLLPIEWCNASSGLRNASGMCRAWIAPSGSLLQP